MRKPLLTVIMFAAVAAPALAQQSAPAPLPTIRVPVPQDISTGRWGPNELQSFNDNQIAPGVPRTARGVRAIRVAELIDKGQCQAARSLTTRERDMRMLRRVQELCGTTATTAM